VNRLQAIPTQAKATTDPATDAATDATTDGAAIGAGDPCDRDQPLVEPVLCPATVGGTRSGKRLPPSLGERHEPVAGAGVGHERDHGRGDDLLSRTTGGAVGRHPSTDGRKPRKGTTGNIPKLAELSGAAGAGSVGSSGIRGTASPNPSPTSIRTIGEHHERVHRVVRFPELVWWDGHDASARRLAPSADDAVRLEPEHLSRLREG
jgi:hypothetical protein